MTSKNTDLTWYKYLKVNNYLYKNQDGSRIVVKIPANKKKEIIKFEDRKIIVDKDKDLAYMAIDEEVTLL